MPRDPRVYITVHNGMPEHPKVEGLSDGAFRLLIELWCLCSRSESDGLVKAATWTKRGTAKARRELLAEGLAHQVPGGVEMHDYLQHQRSRSEIAALREKRAKAGAKGGHATAEARALAEQEIQTSGAATGPANAVANAAPSGGPKATAPAVANGQQNASKIPAETEKEISGGSASVNRHLGDGPDDDPVDRLHGDDESED